MKIILVGKAAAGKDFLKNKLASKGFRTGVSHTTRSPRENEKDGEDYWFISEERFKTMINEGQFIEHMEFNGWFYGQTEEDFNTSDIMIMSKDGLDMLPKKYRNQCIVIYLDPSRLERLRRLESRNDLNDSIVRRMNTDDEQFKSFGDYDIRIANADF
jgi:guanylate kinase|tara:strand:+ start:1431 stop:1904 length:474 start_codon:yes stop_codon:yes gene_type:complete